MVTKVAGGPEVLYIDCHLVHEVTSPVAFRELEKRGLKVFRPEKTFATPDHNVPTIDQHLPIREEMSRRQVDMLDQNCRKHGIPFFGLGHPWHGIVHVIGPELGITRPGMTIVCGDSHTSTHGAFGAIAFGIGTSEVGMVLASQCLLQSRPKQMRITVGGTLGKGVTAKDMALFIISEISAAGGTGHFIEYAGEAVRNLSMEGRMTLCNMSIECGARGGLIAPDEITFRYLQGREKAPSNEAWNQALDDWKSLATDTDASFDTEYHFRAEDIGPMITYGTNPGMAMPVKGHIPEGDGSERSDMASFLKSLGYMGFKPGEQLAGKKVDYVFVGSCTNGRLEDLRAFAGMVKGKRKAPGVTVWIVPGSRQVEKAARNEGIADILEEAGFELRQPGCSACLAMNDDKIPAGKYALSTSNRNFEGRQGPGARTLLVSPLTAAAAALTGVITDPGELIQD